MSIALRLFTLPLSVLFVLVVVSTQASAQGYSPIERGTVRLLVRKGTVSDYGSGTIVRLDGSQATIVSCGHLFERGDRDVAVVVTLFTDRGERQVQGKLLAFDEQSDVSVITAADASGVVAIPMAPSGYRPRVGDPVTVAGCDLGGPVASHAGQVTAVNRCVGYENVEVSTIPENGRSGGGMISQDMRLIAICSGVNPIEQEGIYSSTTCVHELLAKNGRTEPDVASRDPKRPLQTTPDKLASTPKRRAPTNREPLEVVSRTNSPKNLDHDVIEPTEAATAPVEIPLGSSNGPQQPTEVICIVHTPGAKNERRVLVIENASPELLKVLARENAQPEPTGYSPRAIPSVR